MHVSTWLGAEVQRGSPEALPNLLACVKPSVPRLRLHMDSSSENLPGFFLVLPSHRVIPPHSPRGAKQLPQ